MTHTTAPTFLDTLRASDLLPSVVFAKVTHGLPDGPRAADTLVARGHLTRFQAERLLAGRSDGFHLGPYVILDQVGKGSAGRVYKALHTAMNRVVAIKVLSPAVAGTPAAKAAFDREVRAAARLNHPNIVTAYDANEAGGRPYLVLEYVDGPTLAAVVAARGPLPVAEACGYVRQVALGLRHAHDLGMPHRDLKPSNVLVTRPGKGHAGGEVKVSDFGVARLGTPCPAFAAPDPTPDQRADLYSLGCVFAFLLTGHPPFAGMPPRLDLVRPDVPPPVAALVYALLAKHPQARVQTAAEVAARLEGIGGRDGAVNFDLPPPQPGPYSFAAPVADTSPWAQLTEVATRSRRRQPAGVPWAVVGVTVAAAGLVAVVLRALS